MGERDTPNFGHAFSNYTYFRPRGRIWLSSVQQARGLDGEKRKKESWKNISLPTCMSGGLTIVLVDDGSVQAEVIRTNSPDTAELISTDRTGANARRCRNWAPTEHVLTHRLPDPTN